MAGSFSLTLDTTGPDIQIIAPNYVTSSSQTKIKVLASEPLSLYQEFYTIDSMGKRREVTLNHKGDAFEGVFYFSDYPGGIIRFYARVKDEVFNQSAVASTAINLITRRLIRLDINDFSRNAVIQAITRDITAVEGKRRAEISNKAKRVSSRESVREIEVRTEDG